MNGSGRDASAAIDQLYRDHGTVVLRLALRDLGNQADAEDAVQDAFLEAFRALERGDHPRRPREWLLTIAQNVVRRRFRTARPRLGLDGDLLEAPEFDALAAREIVEAVAGVPDAQRSVFLLRELCDLSYDEIAERTGLSVPAVQMHLFRARRRFRAEFAATRLRTPAVLTSWLPRALDLLRGSPALTRAIPVVAIIAVLGGGGGGAKPLLLRAARPTAPVIGGTGVRMPVVHPATASSRPSAGGTSSRRRPARIRFHRRAAAPTATHPSSPEVLQPSATVSPISEPSSGASPQTATLPSSPPIAGTVVDVFTAVASVVAPIASLPELPPLLTPQPATSSAGAIVGGAPVSPLSPAGALPQGAPPHP